MISGRFWRGCAYAQPRQSLRCSHTQSIGVIFDEDENADQIIAIYYRYIGVHALLKTRLALIRSINLFYSRYLQPGYFANSETLDEMLLNATFHQGLQMKSNL